VIGYLHGGMAAWLGAGLPTRGLSEITVAQLRERLHELPVLDVRDQGEWDEGHIEGALYVPYYFIEQQLQAGNGDLQRYIDRPLAVTCASGQRSTIASSILLRHGFTRLFNVVGGMDAWNEKGFATTRLSLNRN